MGKRDLEIFAKLFINVPDRKQNRTLIIFSDGKGFKQST